MDQRPNNRTTGKVSRVLKDYGFITCADVDDQDLYFKTSWFRDEPPLREGDTVTFEIKTFGENNQAHYIRRSSDDAPDSAEAKPVRRTRTHITSLFDWAYLGYMPNTLAELKGLALEEKWDFKEQSSGDPDRPFPILYSYLVHTFGRLALETSQGKQDKIVYSASAQLAAFNTGLVDPRYEPIYALFEPNDQGRCPWQLRGFCVAGEDSNGQNLVRHFNPLPEPPHYFDDPTDLFYNTLAGKPELDWNHIVIERIERYPDEFLDEHWPPQFPRKDVTHKDANERNAYYKTLGAAIKDDSRTYRRIMNRVKDAVDLSIKRASWNYKTAVPQYYPRVRHLQLLLPICLVSDENVDMALAVEKTKSGNYLGHTVLTLDWAYRNARLICRPDSDWLEPDDIVEGWFGEDDA